MAKPKEDEALTNHLLSEQVRLLNRMVVLLEDMNHRRLQGKVYRRKKADKRVAAHFETRISTLRKEAIERAGG